MDRKTAEGEMVQGYVDGYDVNNPQPSSNRSLSYRHGFANARDDRAHKPRDSYANLVKMAENCIACDCAA